MSRISSLDCAFQKQMITDIYLYIPFVFRDSWHSSPTGAALWWLRGKRQTYMMKLISIFPIHKQCWNDSCRVCPSWQLMRLRLMSTGYFLSSSTFFQYIHSIYHSYVLNLQSVYIGFITYFVSSYWRKSKKWRNFWLPYANPVKHVPVTLATPPHSHSPVQPPVTAWGSGSCCKLSWLLLRLVLEAPPGLGDCRWLVLGTAPVDARVLLPPPPPCACREGPTVRVVSA